MATHPKRPRDPIQLAKLIGDIATGTTRDIDPNEGKDKAAIFRGRKGGLIGGKARATKLTDQERSEIAKVAALARWKKS